MCAELGGDGMIRRRLLSEIGMEEDEVSKWVELENKTLEEAAGLNKEYSDSYGEYICCIILPTLSEKINTTASTVFGSHKIYYVYIGSATYKYMIYVHIKQIADNFVLCEAASGELSGIAVYLNCGIKILDQKSTRINCTFDFPAGTQIAVYGR